MNDSMKVARERNLRSRLVRCNFPRTGCKKFLMRVSEGVEKFIFLIELILLINRLINDDLILSDVITGWPNSLSRLDAAERPRFNKIY